jgi:hypothetical protein
MDTMLTLSNELFNSLGISIHSDISREVYDRENLSQPLQGNYNQVLESVPGSWIGIGTGNIQAWVNQLPTENQFTTIANIIRFIESKKPRLPIVRQEVNNRPRSREEIQHFVDRLFVFLGISPDGDITTQDQYDRAELEKTGATFKRRNWNYG